jgi:hypothetical protein
LLLCILSAINFCVDVCSLAMSVNACSNAFLKSFQCYSSALRIGFYAHVLLSLSIVTCAWAQSSMFGPFIRDSTCIHCSEVRNGHNFMCFIQSPKKIKLSHKLFALPSVFSECKWNGTSKFIYRACLLTCLCGCGWCSLLLLTCLLLCLLHHNLMN